MSKPKSQGHLEQWLFDSTDAKNGADAMARAQFVDLVGAAEALLKAAIPASADSADSGRLEAQCLRMKEVLKRTCDILVKIAPQAKEVTPA